VFDKEEMLLAEIDLDRTREERLALDVAGHYSRPDIFELTVRRERRSGLRDA
jgi:nitrilase